MRTTLNIDSGLLREASKLTGVSGPEINSKIIEGLHHLSLMSGLEPKGLASLLPEKLWEMCFHFVGPHEVQMTARGKVEVLMCIDALETLAEFNCEFGHSIKAVDAVAEHAENFMDIGIWYKDKKIVGNVITLYKKAISACEADHDNFLSGRKVLEQSLKKLSKRLASESPIWKGHRARISGMIEARKSRKGA